MLDPKPDKVTYQLFASGLHEPLGLLREGKDLLVTQRTETTRPGSYTPPTLPTDLRL